MVYVLNKTFLLSMNIQLSQIILLNTPKNSVTIITMRLKKSDKTVCRVCHF